MVCQIPYYVHHALHIGGLQFFVSAELAQSHKRQNHFYCDDCDDVFIEEDHLEEHYEEEHWYCRSCKKVRLPFSLPLPFGFSIDTRSTVLQNQ